MRYALDVHPDDVALWRDMTGRYETRPYDMPPLLTASSIEFMQGSARRNGVRILAVREIPEERS
jgi:hypothetical protein